jgi:hypothetical protein
MKNSQLKTIIDTPANLSKQYKSEVIDLICLGGQVNRHFVVTGIDRATLIGIVLNNEKIICSVTLKVPVESYLKGVFKKAGVSVSANEYPFELGYIITHPDFERRGLCQTLLNEFMPRVAGKAIFATSRKPSMIHILGKHGFNKIGNTYDTDLNLLIRKPTNP